MHHQPILRAASLGAPFLTLAVLVSSARAQIHVPGDYPDLQQAIDAAQPNETIVVHGGTWISIRIPKPLTIVGDPTPLLTADTSIGGQPPSVRLEGPGYGTVVLSNVRIKNTATIQTYQPGTPIFGGGFEQLHVIGSEIQPSNAGVGGLTKGAPAIQVTVPLVVIAKSAVFGSYSYDDSSHCASGWAGYPGGAGIQAPGTVVVLDSIVAGGAGTESYFPSTPHPCPCPELLAKGGPGIVANRVFSSASTIAGGSGGPVYGSQWDCASFYGYNDNGPASITSELHELANDLIDFGEPTLGGSWTLHMAPSWHGVWLLLGTGVADPFEISGIGWVFFDVSTLLFAGQVGSSFGATTTLAIPASPQLVGLEIVAQGFTPTVGFTRPLIETLMP